MIDETYNKNILLSIAIPTYNRKNKLKDSLDRLLSSIDVTDEIELFISDNASTDGTQEYIQELVRSKPCIKYYRNDRNLGLDGNFYQCFHRAQGKYLLMLSDDDYILPESWEFIFESLKYNPTFVHMNNYYEHIESNNRYRERGIVVYNDKNEFLRAMNIYITYVSSLIYNMENVRKISNIDSLYGDGLLLSRVAILSIKEDSPCILITNNCIDTSNSVVRGYDFYKTWFPKLKELFLELAVKNGFKENTMKEILLDSWKNEVLRTLITQRRIGCGIEPWEKSFMWREIMDDEILKELYRFVIETPQEMLNRGISEDIYNIRKREILLFAKKHKSVYLYGAGKNAEKVYKYLIDNKIIIKGILLSYGERKQYFHSLPIIYINDRKNICDSYGIIVSVKRKIQYEIRLEILDQKISNDILYFDWLF